LHCSKTIFKCGVLIPKTRIARPDRRIGAVEQTKQSHRDERSILWLEQTGQDLRHACRTLTRNPGFTFAAVITLALGIGVNTTLFTAYDAVALRPLPVANPGSVVRLERWLESGFAGDAQYAFSWPEYVYCHDHQDAFRDLVATSWPLHVLAAISDGGERTQSKNLQGQMVSGNYFSPFGIDAAPGPHVWPKRGSGAWCQSRHCAESCFLATRIPRRRAGCRETGEDQRHRLHILGVAPRAFTGTSLLPQVPHFWAPASMQGQLAPGQDWLRQPTDFEFQVLGRLKPAVV
jgi:hypothetical protein